MKHAKMIWHFFSDKHKGIAQFMVFFMISNGVTVLQMLLMPMIKYLFESTAMVEIGFQIFPVGNNLDGSTYYVFDYAKGTIANGGGGGLAYFLAVEITLFTAQVVNFFLQRNITFKSQAGIAKTAVWYFIAWLIISIGASALQGLYKIPVYSFLISAMGTVMGTAMADIVTMLINCIISFWVFFPIMKLLFK